MNGACKTGVGDSTSDDAAVLGGDAAGSPGDAAHSGNTGSKTDGSFLGSDFGSGAKQFGGGNSPAPSSGCGAARAQGSSGWLAFLGLIGTLAWIRHRLRQREATIG